MSKKKKNTIDFDYEIDFETIAISCHLLNYRLAWEINNGIGIQLIQSEEPYAISIHKKKEVIRQEHEMYEYLDEENKVNYYLIQNLSNGKLLIPEYQAIDYFLFIQKKYAIDLQKQLKKLKEIKPILGLFNIDESACPSLKNIIFES